VASLLGCHLISQQQCTVSVHITAMGQIPLLYWEFEPSASWMTVKLVYGRGLQLAAKQLARGAEAKC